MFLTLLVASFAWIFMQAFQSRNVNSGQIGWAAAGSIAIGNLQVYVLSVVVTAHGSFLLTQLYCLGGGLGVVTAMLVHKRLFRAKLSAPSR